MWQWPTPFQRELLRLFRRPKGHAPRHAPTGLSHLGRIIFGVSDFKIMACAFHPRHEAISAQCAPQRSTRHPPRPTKFGVEFWLPATTTPPLCLEQLVTLSPLHTFQCITYAGISSEATTIPVLWRVPSTSLLSIGLYFPPIDSRLLNDLLPPKRSLPQTSAERTVLPPKR